MRDTPERLFAIFLGPVIEEITHPCLNDTVTRIAQSVLDLLSAANLAGRFECVHGAIDGRRVVNVDVEGSIKKALTLFAPDGDKSFPAEEAGNLVVNNAVRILREFAASDQPLQAQDVVRAAAKVKRLTEENPVINALRREPGQVMRLSTRDGTISLSLQASDGNTVSGEEVQIRATLRLLGPQSAVITVDDESRKKLHRRIRRSTKLQIPAGLADDAAMQALFVIYVLPGREVELLVQAVEEKRTGKFIGLQLSKLPSLD